MFAQCLQKSQVCLFAGRGHSSASVHSKDDDAPSRKAVILLQMDALEISDLSDMSQTREHRKGIGVFLAQVSLACFLYQFSSTLSKSLHTLIP